jgi:PhnB protein
MQISPYLSFKGECEAAFKLYEQCLGGKPGAMFRYGGSPMAGDVPADWSDKIMHGSITVAGQVLMGADNASQQYEQPKGFSLALHMKSAAEGERIYRELSKGGKVVVPFAKTFWAEGFAMIVDRFGIPWAINCGEQETAGEAEKQK